MKKKFKMQGLDCANCAAKMETEIKKLSGVNQASISFMTQRLVIDAEEAAFDEVLDSAQKICSKIDAGCKIII